MEWRIGVVNATKYERLKVQNDGRSEAQIEALSENSCSCTRGADVSRGSGTSKSACCLVTRAIKAWNIHVMLTDTTGHLFVGV